MTPQTTPLINARSQAILQLIARLNDGHFELRAETIQPDDDLDHILLALGKLAGTLSARSAAQQQIEAQLRVSLNEKETLLKEIHHRVKNNLQIISSLLYLQSRKITDQAILDMFQDGQNRVKSMALVHEKLYQAQDLANVDFADYLRNLARYLFRSYRVARQDIALKVNVEPLSLAVDIAIPCGLIVNELLSNALKHAFPKRQAGEVALELRQNNEQHIVLIIRDNGVGFPEDLNFKRTNSLGLQLVNNLVRQLNGTIELTYDNGCVFHMTFPQNRKRV